MMKKYRVEMNNQRRQELELLVGRGKSSARQIRRAHTLLMSVDGKSDEEIAELLRINPATVHNTRQRWAEERLSRGLLDKPKTGRPTKLNGKQEAYLAALACTDAPEGRERWTLQLLADKLVQLNVIDEPISYETVRNRLKKTNSSPGSRNSGVFQLLAQTSCGGWKTYWTYMPFSNPGCQWFVSMSARVCSGRIAEPVLL